MATERRLSQERPAVNSGPMSDRVFFPLAFLAIAAIVALAIVWP